LINNFLDRNEPVRPTLALEYSFARRTNSSGQSSQKLIGNIWELGSLANSSQLIDVPIKSHGLRHFSAVIMLNLAEPAELLIDLESALQGLKQSISNNYSEGEIRQYKDKIIDNGACRDHPDINTVEIMPCKVVIVGGMYDKFENLDPEIKKHVVRFLRSISHTIGASLVFYSTKVPSLSKTLRDVMNNLSFGSPQNPIRANKTDYNGAVLISHFDDSWEKIGVTPTNSERIAITFSSQIQQNKAAKENKESNDPAKDQNFREPVIDDLRAMKDEELFRLIKNSEMKVKFDSFNLANSPFNYLN
jgi:dynein light intermediate chain 2, cytosolic